MKEKVLYELRKSGNSYVSGEALSELLGVSRTAIWKYVRELREKGYNIQSSSKKGYKLSNVPDLNADEIANGLQTNILGKSIIYLDTVDSTNRFAKRASLEGCQDGTVIVSECQTSGRGRLGRDWHSGRGKGIWMSVVLRPSIAPEDVQIITLAAAVAVVKAIKYVTGIETAIKWPNDIILDGKKLCGILTEMSCEVERVSFLILGIGINVSHNKEDFPQDLRDIATSLKIFSKSNETSSIFNRSEIIKRVLFELEQMYNKINIGAANETDQQNIDVKTGNDNGQQFITAETNNYIAQQFIASEWRKYSLTLGKEINVTGRNTQFTGIAEDITNDGRLIVRGHDGVQHELLSGEVSIRGEQ